MRGEWGLQEVWQETRLQARSHAGGDFPFNCPLVLPFLSHIITLDCSKITRVHGNVDVTRFILSCYFDGLQLQST